MSETYIIKQCNPRLRLVAESAINAINVRLQHGLDTVVTLKDPTRSLEQNALLHVLCDEVSKTQLWAGRKRDPDGWKRLFVDAWARVEQRQQSDIVPSLDGESVVNLGIQTRKMPIKEMIDLIDFIRAWCAENNVRIDQ